MCVCVRGCVCVCVRVCVCGVCVFATTLKGFVSSAMYPKNQKLPGLNKFLPDLWVLKGQRI